MVNFIKRLIVTILISLFLCVPAFAGMNMGAVCDSGSSQVTFCQSATTTTNRTV